MRRRCAVHCGIHGCHAGPHLGMWHEAMRQSSRSCLSVKAHTRLVCRWGNTLVTPTVRRPVEQRAAASGGSVACSWRPTTSSSRLRGTDMRLATGVEGAMPVAMRCSQVCKPTREEQSRYSASTVGVFRRESSGGYSGQLVAVDRGSAASYLTTYRKTRIHDP